MSTPYRDFVARAIHQPIHDALDEGCRCPTIPDDQDVAVALALLNALDSAGYEIVPKAQARKPCDDDHTWGLVYDAENDVMTCPECGHRQHEEMGA